MRDVRVIDSELRLLAAIRRMVWEVDGRVSCTTQIDNLLEERRRLLPPQAAVVEPVPTWLPELGTKLIMNPTSKTKLLG
jgi:hypothetical protein